MATLKALKNKARLEKKIAKGVEEEDRAVNQSKLGPGILHSKHIFDTTMLADILLFNQTSTASISTRRTSLSTTLL